MKKEILTKSDIVKELIILTHHNTFYFVSQIFQKVYDPQDSDQFFYTLVDAN